MDQEAEDLSGSGDALRCHVLAADGSSNTAIAQQLGVTLQTVGKWRQCYLDQGLDSLLEEPRAGYFA